MVVMVSEIFGSVVAIVRREGIYSYFSHRHHWYHSLKKTFASSRIFLHSFPPLVPILQSLSPVILMPQFTSSIHHTLEPPTSLSLSLLLSYNSQIFKYGPKIIIIMSRVKYSKFGNICPAAPPLELRFNYFQVVNLPSISLASIPTLIL